MRSCSSLVSFGLMSTSPATHRLQGAANLRRYCINGNPLGGAFRCSRTMLMARSRTLLIIGAHLNLVSQCVRPIKPRTPQFIANPVQELFYGQVILKP